jgi:hypothetical protein
VRGTPGIYALPLSRKQRRGCPAFAGHDVVE